MSPGDDEELPYICLSKNNFESFARELLLVKNYRVEVYVNQGQKQNNDWKLEYRGSPGNLVQFEDLIFNNSDVISNATTIGISLRKENNQMVNCQCYYYNVVQLIFIFNVSILESRDCWS